MNRRSIVVTVIAALSGCAKGSPQIAASYEASSGGAYGPSPTTTSAASGAAYGDSMEGGYGGQTRAPREAILTASSVGDHDRRGDYLDFLERHAYEVHAIDLDTRRRQRVQVVDARGHALRGAVLSIDGRRVGTTYGDGIGDIYPGVVGVSAGPHVLGVTFGGVETSVEIVIPDRGDADDVRVHIGHATAVQPRRLELAFLVDVTGSMEDELRYVNHEIGGIVERVREGATGVDVRVGATFYRDRMDATPLSRIAFTHDIDGFANAMSGVAASGGGDYPEDLDTGLEAVLHQLAWSDGDAVRVVVLITDAPPKVYDTQFGYREALVEASRRGIRILPVAASGADRTVEVLLRAMGSITGAPYVFLTDDSGVGASHLEADTDRIRVEHFSLLLARLLLADLAGIGMHEPGYGGVPDFDQ